MSRTLGVVVGLDTSAACRAAVAYAADEALRRHVVLTLLHAFEPSQYAVRPHPQWPRDEAGVEHNPARQLVDETVDALRAAHPRLRVRAELPAGSAVVELVGASDHAELVVVGSRGSGGFTDLVIGSTTLHVASLARCPVVAVPAPAPGAAPDDSDRHGVVVGVDGSALSEAAVEFAFQAASQAHERLTALHAWRQPAWLGPGMMAPPVYDVAVVGREEELVLAESMTGWSEKYPDVEVVQRVVHEHPVGALTSAAAQARLLVVGSHGRGPVRSLLLGSVSHGVLHHATGPVAVVRVRSAG